MPIDEERPVIAVFGANHPGDGELLAARLLGEQVNRSGSVLLTGGDGTDPRTVKDATLVAAQALATRDGPATWIGVRNRSAAAGPEWRGPRAVVVTPGWGHRRNFVEACLCDAAVVVGASSAGAASEALFCLYLGRPVVVVRRPSEAATDAAALRALAQTRIPTPRQRRLAVDVGIAGAYDWADAPDRRAEVRVLPADPRSAADLVTEVRDGIDRRSPRASLEALLDEASWDGYVRAALHAAGR